MSALVASRRATRTLAYRRAAVTVSRWGALYTRGLDPVIAAGRRDELASDLWEQGADADARGASGARTALSITGRWLRGIPSDLSWRHARGPARDPLLTGWSGRGSVLVAVVLAVAVLAVGVIASVRMLIGALRGIPITESWLLVTVPLMSAFLLLALLALRTPRRRWAAAFVCAAVVPVLLHLGLRALIESSATVGGLYDGVIAFGPAWQALPVLCGLGALSLFYLAMAVAWFPASTRQAAAR